jgi:hypothetical protein
LSGATIHRSDLISKDHVKINQLEDNWHFLTILEFKSWCHMFHFFGDGRTVQPWRYAAGLGNASETAGQFQWRSAKFFAFSRLLPKWEREE